MPTNFSAALPKERAAAPSYTTIDANIGAHNARMIGFTESWEQEDGCFDCNKLKPNPPNPDCKKCEGRGKVVGTFINIKYLFKDGHIDQERVPFKISAPRSFIAGGRHITTKPSKFYERLIEFTKNDGNDPTDPERAWSEHRIASWAEAHQDSADIPVLVVIKQPNKYPKIVEVLYRTEAAPKAESVAAHRQPDRTMSVIAERAKENAALADEHPFDDDDAVPF